MTANWYYKLGDETHGPFTTTDLRQLAHVGKIGSNSIVRQGKDGKWCPAHQIKGLLEQNATTKPPEPPLKKKRKELKFRLEDEWLDAGADSGCAGCLGGFFPIAFVISFLVVFAGGSDVDLGSLLAALGFVAALLSAIGWVLVAILDQLKKK